VPRDGLDTYDVYYPRHLLEGLDPQEIRDWAFWRAPVGNGPYRYVRHVPQTLVELEANPDYFLEKPKIDRAILKFIPDEGSYFVELSSGNVDAISYVSLELPMMLSHDDRFRFYHWWGADMRAIYWNNRHPYLNHPEVRRALTRAINRPELTRILNYPGEIPFVDTIVTPRLFRKKDYPPPLTYDPDQARRILEDMGWRDSNNDGLLDRGGDKFQFELMLADPILESGAVFVQAELRKVGVKMDIQFFPRTVMLERFKRGDYDAMMHYFKNELSQPNWGQIRMFGSGSPLAYDNPVMDRLLRQAEITFEAEERDKIFRTIMPIFQEDMPATFLVPEVVLFVAHRRIKGLRNNIMVDPVSSLEHLWIEEDSK
jgi:peptide/nickel transport system substrate-binding protein